MVMMSGHFAVSHDHKPDQSDLLKQYVVADPEIQKEPWKLQFRLGFNP
ncbi:hypothetical protein Hanom_Chr05g00423821 [Helianthus anomalus]